MLDGIDCDALARIRTARAQAREVAWAQRADTRGDFPQAKAAGREIPGLELEIDASVVIRHSEKAGPGPDTSPPHSPGSQYCRVPLPEPAENPCELG